MKFTLNQSVLLKRYNPWIGDYDISATIIGFGEYFSNGKMTYKIKTIDGEILNNISGEQLSIRVLK